MRELLKSLIYLENYHAPEFNSNASEFHVTMWNLNYAMDGIKDNPHVVKAPEDVVKETEDAVKAKANDTKESAQISDCKHNKDWKINFRIGYLPAYLPATTKYLPASNTKKGVQPISVRFQLYALLFIIIQNVCS